MPVLENPCITPEMSRTALLRKSSRAAHHLANARAKFYSRATSVFNRLIVEFRKSFLELSGPVDLLVDGEVVRLKSYKDQVSIGRELRAAVEGEAALLGFSNQQRGPTRNISPQRQLEPVDADVIEAAQRALSERDQRIASGQQPDPETYEAELAPASEPPK